MMWWHIFQTKIWVHFRSIQNALKFKFRCTCRAAHKERLPLSSQNAVNKAWSVQVEADLYFQAENFNLPRLKFYFANILDLWFDQTGLSFWTIGLFYNFSSEENWVFYNWVCMHMICSISIHVINLCHLTFIIGYPRNQFDVRLFTF